jgi:hypothetical protein
MTELAKLALEDGQTMRPFVDYLMKTFKDIKGKEFSFDGTTFETEEQFYDHVAGVAEWLSEQNKKELQGNSRYD